MQNILDFFENTWNNITVFLGDFTVWLLDKILIWFFDQLIYFADLAFNIFTSLVSGLSFDQYLVSAVSNLDPTVGYVFGILKLGSYIQIVFSAHITRLVLKVVVPFY